MDCLENQIKKFGLVFSAQNIKDFKSFKNPTLLNEALNIISGARNNKNVSRNNLLKKLEQSKNCFKSEALSLGINGRNFIYHYYRFESALLTNMLGKLSC